MRAFRLNRAGVTGNALILLVTVFIVVLGNVTFFSGVLKTYGVTAGNAPALLSLVVLLGTATAWLPALLAFGRTTKPVLIAMLLIAAPAAYFMDSFGIVINDEMLQNAAQTNVGEARDLFSLRLLGYLALLGILPAWFVWRVPLQWRGWRIELLARLKFLALLLVMLVGPVLLFGGFYASFAREHKTLRSYANPTYALYSLGKFLHAGYAASAGKTVAAIGTDVRIPPHEHRDLVFLVVGETARADHFALNGYARDTNPLLRQSAVISFDNFHACGTSTAVSVPCMFSLAGSAGSRADTLENVLDVVQRAGVHVLWLDNNSDSKGVALRVPYIDYKSPQVNTVCDIECRDAGMLVPLQDYIDRHPDGDILVVLHQMGNHGPAYYKRYPAEFEKFTPACRDNDLSRCSQQEIINAYDNALLYTDYFLAKAIDLLKKNDSKFETALFYVSDHGESLGEAGTWLHGLPRAIAPDAQLHVPAIMWFGTNFDELDVPALRKKRNDPFTHDNLFHTLLGFMEVETSIYRQERDILDGCRKPDERH